MQSMSSEKVNHYKGTEFVSCFTICCCPVILSRSLFSDFVLSLLVAPFP